MSSLYSQHKALWHLDRLADLREGRRPRPVHVQLILCDLCNHDCSFCAYRMSSGLSSELFKTAQTHNPNRKIPTAKAEEIIRDCAELGVQAIQFTGGGEPTVHPAHLELFALAQSLGMETALVTNGVKVDPCHPAIRAMQWIRVSVDAGTEETYRQVRRCPRGHWTRVWKNLEWLGRYSYAAFPGTLGIGYVVTRENYKEIRQAAEKAEKAGVANMRVGAVFSEEGPAYYGDILPHIYQELVRAEEATAGYRLQFINLFGRRVEDLAQGRPTHAACAYQYLTMYIGGDLNVYRCCNTAYTASGKVGSLQSHRLRDLFPDLMYDPFDARSCTACQFRGQNEVLRGAVEKPLHANFV